MATSQNDSLKYIPWNWVVPVMLSVIIMVVAYIISDMRTRMDLLSREKLDRVEYIKDYEQRRADMKTITEKLDSLQGLMLRHVGEGVRK